MATSPPSSASAAAPAVSPALTPAHTHVLQWGGPKQCLMVKEGVHIILDRILIKDNTHLIVKCPLYGRLSRVEKRAAVLRYATALLQRAPLVRNVLVDTLCVCVAEACEAEGRLEAIAAAAGGADKRSKPRVPFMQRVIGEALEEALMGNLTPEDKDVVNLLVRQKAPQAIVTESMARLRAAWLSPAAASFFAMLSEAGVAKQPPIIYSKDVERVFGIDYFLPPPPTFSVDDERMLADAIRRDEEEAGKETVFAANLKKALKLLRQNRLKTAPGLSSTLTLASVAPIPSVSAASAGGRASSSPAAADPDAANPAAMDATVAALDALSEVAPRPATPAEGTLPPADAAIGPIHPRACETAIPRADDELSGAGGTVPSSTSASAAGTGRARHTRHDWWSDLRWVGQHCRVSPTDILRELHDRPAAWLACWNAPGEWSDSARREVLSLTADETCDVIDHQPLWLSLRGMVGTNLYADGMWPITSNDGQLAVVKFRRSDKSRFWYIDPSAADPAQLTAVFLSWARTITSTLRSELRSVGDAASTEAGVDEVARAVQKHLESAILSFMLMKAVCTCIEKEAARAADRLGTLLMLEEEKAAAERQSKASKKKGKNKSKAAAEAGPTASVTSNGVAAPAAAPVPAATGAKVSTAQPAPRGRTPPRATTPPRAPVQTAQSLLPQVTVSPLVASRGIPPSKPRSMSPSDMFDEETGEDEGWEQVVHRRAVPAVGPARREGWRGAAPQPSRSGAEPPKPSMQAPVRVAPGAGSSTTAPRWPVGSPMKASSAPSDDAPQSPTPTAAKRTDWAGVVRPAGATAKTGVAPPVPAPALLAPAALPTAAFSPMKADAGQERGTPPRAASPNSTAEGVRARSLSPPLSPQVAAVVINSSLPAAAAAANRSQAGSHGALSSTGAASATAPALAPASAGSPILPAVSLQFHGLEMSPPRVVRAAPAVQPTDEFAPQRRALAPPSLAPGLASSMSWVTNDLSAAGPAALGGFPVSFSEQPAGAAGLAALGSLPPSSALSGLAGDAGVEMGSGVALGALSSGVDATAPLFSLQGLSIAPQSAGPAEPLFVSAGPTAELSAAPAARGVSSASVAGPATGPSVRTGPPGFTSQNVILKATVKNAPPGLLPTATSAPGTVAEAVTSPAAAANMMPQAPGFGSAAAASLGMFSQGPAGPAAQVGWPMAPSMPPMAAGLGRPEDAMMMLMMLQGMQAQQQAAGMGLATGMPPFMTSAPSAGLNPGGALMSGIPPMFGASAPTAPPAGHAFAMAPGMPGADGAGSATQAGLGGFSASWLMPQPAPLATGFGPLDSMVSPLAGAPGPHVPSGSSASTAAGHAPPAASSWSGLFGPRQ